MNKKYKVFAQSHNEVFKIIDSQFIEYVNNSKNNFSYLFKKNYAYILYPHKKDYFKIGSLFKNAKDKQQYEACKQYLILMFQELEKFASNTWAKKQ